MSLSTNNNFYLKMYNLFLFNFKVVGKECMWTAYDYALNPPKRRLLKAVFSSHQGAEEMYMNFDDVSNFFLLYYLLKF